MGTQSILLYRKPLKFIHSSWNLHDNVNKEQPILCYLLRPYYFSRKKICAGENLLLEPTKCENGFHIYSAMGCVKPSFSYSYK